MSRHLRSFRARIGLIALAGLVIRLVYVFGPARNVKGIGDWYFFHWGANLIADGHWFVEPFEQVFHGKLVPSAGHPPLWELLLSGVSFLGGTSYLAHRAFGCFVGAVTIVLIGMLGRRVGGSERAGVVAAVIAAIYPVMIAADGSLMSEGLYGLLVTSALLLALKVYDGGGARPAAGLGAVIALAALTRSEALVLIPLLALPVALTRVPRRAGLIRALACCAAAALVLAPWLVRNWAEFGRPVLVSTNDGTLLAGANCDLTYHGRDLGFWNIACISKRSIANEAQQAARWRSQGATYIGDHLSRLPAVIAVRILRTWDLYQPRRMVLFAEGRWIRADQAGIVAYFLLLPFAFAGGWLIRRRRAELLIMLAPVAMVFVQSVIGYGIPRFRHAAEIAIVVLAAVAITRLLERRRARRAGEDRSADWPPGAPARS
jgi:4-amino-4-deoxy-L-arabinose transferase-like glycosyltransferase